MKCVILQDGDGSHLGFMLCSADLAEDSGNCVFMAVPGRIANLDAPGEDLLLRRRRAGESDWQVTGREPLSVIVRTPGLADDLFVELPGSGAGRWGIEGPTGRQVVGLAKLPPNG